MLTFPLALPYRHLCGQCKQLWCGVPLLGIEIFFVVDQIASL